MRIIAGKARSTKLKIPKYQLRPTNDRVKETLFAILGNITDWVVVDLFAGTGSLGLEALSRGAKTLRIVEQHPKGIRCIQENLQAVKKAMNTPQIDATIIRADAEHTPQILANLKQKIDLILADPPYHTQKQQFGAEKMLQSNTFAQWAGTAILVLEHDPTTTLPWFPKSPWQIIKQKRFGTRMLTFAQTKK